MKLKEWKVYGKEWMIEALSQTADAHVRMLGKCQAGLAVK
jgi:hypothetical protein